MCAIYTCIWSVKKCSHLLNFCWMASFNSVKWQTSSKCRWWFDTCWMTIFVDVCQSTCQSPVACHRSLSEEDKTFVKLYEIECVRRGTKWHNSVNWSNLTNHKNWNRCWFRLVKYNELKKSRVSVQCAGCVTYAVWLLSFDRVVCVSRQRSTKIE